MSDQIDQTGIFPRLLDMQREYNDRIVNIQSEYNERIGKVYDEIRKWSDQNSKIFGVLDQIAGSIDDIKKRLEKAEEVKHATPCSTACGLVKDLEIQRKETNEIQKALREIEDEQKSILEEFKDIQKSLEKIEKEKQENKKTWKDISVHIAKYVFVLAAGGIIFLLGSGLSAYLASLKGN